MSSYSTLDSYEILKVLGKGGTAKVKLSRHTETGDLYAIKIMKTTTPNMLARFRDMVQNEINSLNRIQHPNIVNLIQTNEHGTYTKKNNGGVYSCMYLVMELCPNGELFDVLYHTGRFSEAVSRTLFKQLIEGIEACHTAGITHRDLKPENLLFDADCNLKITDFGFAVMLSGRDGSGMLHTHLGTESYMAPEVHMRNPYNGVSVDLFAAGIILFIMYSQNPPFSKADQRDPYYQLLASKNEKFWQLHSRNKPPNYYSKEFRNLIESMLAFDPTQRPSIAEIKSHPWYNGPSASLQDLASDISARRRNIMQTAERARMQRNRAGGRVAGGRVFKADVSESEGLSLSFTIPHEDLAVRKLPPCANRVVKYSQILAGLNPQELMTIISHYLRKVDAETEFNLEDCKVTATVVTETDSLNFTVNLWDAGEDLYMIDFSKNSGTHFDFMKLISEIGQMIEETQNNS